MYTWNGNIEGVFFPWFNISTLASNFQIFPMTSIGSILHMHFLGEWKKNRENNSKYADKWKLSEFSELFEFQK